MSWAPTEFESMDLGDPKRKQRAIRLIERLSAQPTASVPQACGDWADTLAAYSFFDNERVAWEGILTPHIECSVARMAMHPVVLCIQDTTELNFNGQQANGRQKVPDKAPTLNEVLRLVARLGGFLARKGDGEPGVKTIWLSMQRVLDFAAGIRFLRELQAQGTCV